MADYNFVEYRYPWTFIAKSSLYSNSTDSSAVCNFSRAYITDYDLQKKSQQGGEELEAAMAELEVSDESHKPRPKRGLWKNVPKTFMKKGQRATKKREGNWRDYISFDEYWEDAKTFYINRTWLNVFGPEMEECDRSALEASLLDAAEDLVLLRDQVIASLSSINRDDPCFKLQTYEEIWTVLCEEVTRIVTRQFDLFSARRASKRCAEFLGDIQGLGFTIGPKKLCEEEERKEEEHFGGGDCKGKDENSTLPGWDDIFDDVSYEIYDPHLSDKVIVLEKENNEEEKKEEDEVLEVPSGEGPSSSSDEIRLDFDPEKDACLIAKNAREVYSKDNEIKKYWFQRYRLFTKFDDGVVMDREGWFSVTPERIAQHIADRMVISSGRVIMDAFAGVGGNSIQLALKGAHVIAVDLDPVRLKCARENARVYGVLDKIDFILGDFFHVASSWDREGNRPIDAIFLSPPWGGPGYLKSEEFDISRHMIPDGIDIFNAAKAVSPNIAYFLPRHTSLKQIISLAGQGGKCEIEQSCLNKKIKTITVYYGDLVAEE